MRSRSRLKTNATLVVASGLLAAVLFVAGFEIYGYVEYRRWKAGFDNKGWFGKLTVPSPHEGLMWEYKPYGQFENIRTNRYGFRDIDRDLEEKPAGSLRVAFVGDSITLGFGVDAERTFVRRFEVLARQRGHRVEALNFGIDGYNTGQVHGMVRARVLEFSPDVVVYAMALNDFDYEGEASGAKTLYFSRPSSFFLLRARRLYRQWTGIDYHLYHYRRNGERAVREITALRDLLSERGIPFHVVLVPVFPRESESFRDYPLRSLHEEFREALDARGVQVHDLLPVFRSEAEPPRRFAEDVWHPNAAGHQLIAEDLLSSGIGVPPSCSELTGPAPSSSAED